MYEGWQFERWDTPVSDAKSPSMVSLTHINGAFKIVLEDVRDSERRRYCIEFEWVPAYRNIQEQFRMSLWNQLPKGEERRKLGSTYIIPNSKWIESFCGYEPIFELDVDKYKHYMICTIDDVVEVITQVQPKIYEVTPGEEEKDDEPDES